MNKRFVILILAFAAPSAGASAQQGFAPRDTLTVTRCGPSGCERISGYVIPAPDPSDLRPARLSAPGASATNLRLLQALGPSRLYLETGAERR